MQKCPLPYLSVFHAGIINVCVGLLHDFFFFFGHNPFVVQRSTRTRRGLLQHINHPTPFERTEHAVCVQPPLPPHPLPKKGEGSTTLTLRNRLEVERTRNGRYGPAFIHVVSGSQGTVQSLEQLSLAAAGRPTERRPVH